MWGGGSVEKGPEDGWWASFSSGSHTESHGTYQSLTRTASSLSAGVLYDYWGSGGARKGVSEHQFIEWWVDSWASKLEP